MLVLYTPMARSLADIGLQIDKGTPLLYTKVQPACLGILFFGFVCKILYRDESFIRKALSN